MRKFISWKSLKIKTPHNFKIFNFLKITLISLINCAKRDCVLFYSYSFDTFTFVRGWQKITILFLNILNFDWKFGHAVFGRLTWLREPSMFSHFWGRLAVQLKLFSSLSFANLVPEKLDLVHKHFKFLV